MASSKLKGLTKYHWMGIALVVVVLVVIIVVPVVLTQSDKKSDKTTTTTTNAKVPPFIITPVLKGYRSYIDGSLLKIDANSNFIYAGDNEYLTYNMNDETQLFYAPFPFPKTSISLSNLFVLTPYVENGHTYYYFKSVLYNSFAKYALRYDGNTVSLDKLVNNTPKHEHLFMLDPTVKEAQLNTAALKLRGLLHSI